MTHGKTAKFRILVLLAVAAVFLFLFAMMGTLWSRVVARGSFPSKINEITSRYLPVININIHAGIPTIANIIHGGPFPLTGFEARQASVTNFPASAKVLSVPAYTWVDGCYPVSAAMIAGYYDRNGYPNIYTGPTNGGVMPMTDSSSWPVWWDPFPSLKSFRDNPLVASHKGVDGRITKGTIDDYWVQLGSTKPDPFIGNWTEHTWGDAIGDYTKTSQSKYGNIDGSTKVHNYPNNVPDKLTCSDMITNKDSSNDGTFGLKLFYEAKGYTVTDCYNQNTDNIVSGGFSMADFRAQIDGRHPVLLDLADHAIVGIGYESATSNTIYVYDTSDTIIHPYTWGKDYAGIPLHFVSIVNLAPDIPVPQSPNGTITVSKPTFTWTRVAGATLYSFSVYKGTSLVYSKAVVPTACVTATCSNTPTNVLSVGAYSWSVRAFIGKIWQPYSPRKIFTIDGIAFDSEFSSNADGWTPLNGKWSVKNGYYQATGGAQQTEISAVHDNLYAIFTYEVKLKLQENSHYEDRGVQSISFNGTPRPMNGSGNWYESYDFLIYKDSFGEGSFDIWLIGSNSSYLGGGSSPAITDGWNTLKVTYNASTNFAQFFINHTRVAYGTLKRYPYGQVGIGYGVKNSPGTLYFDYARLSLTAPSSDSAGGGIHISDSVP